MEKIDRPLLYMLFFDHKYLKLGITNNFYRRAKEIKRGLPILCCGAMTLRVDKYSTARELEKIGKNLLSNLSCVNSKEWFDYSDCRDSTQEKLEFLLSITIPSAIQLSLCRFCQRRNDC